MAVNFTDIELHFGVVVVVAESDSQQMLRALTDVYKGKMGFIMFDQNNYGMCYF